MELVQPALPPGRGGYHPASLYAGDHAEIVSRTATMRKLIAAGDGIAELGYGDAGHPVKGAEIMGHRGGVIVYHCRDD